MDTNENDCYGEADLVQRWQLRNENARVATAQERSQWAAVRATRQSNEQPVRQARNVFGIRWGKPEEEVML